MNSRLPEQDFTRLVNQLIAKRASAQELTSVLTEMRRLRESEALLARALRKHVKRYEGRWMSPEDIELVALSETALSIAEESK